MKVYQYKEDDMIELISDYVSRKYGEKCYIESVNDGRKVSVEEDCAMYTDGIFETSDSYYNITTVNGFNVIILLYYGDKYSDMEKDQRLQIYYNKHSSMSFGNFKKLITKYIDTYVETYT